MMHPSDRTAEYVSDGEQTYCLTLFIAGNEPNSLIARENLEALCEAELTGRYDLEIVDVLQNFQRALDNGVMLVPTLIIEKPQPKVTILGNLSDTNKVRKALRLRSN